MRRDAGQAVSRVRRSGAGAVNLRMVVNLLARGLLFLSLAMVPCILPSLVTGGGGLPGLAAGFTLMVAAALVMLFFSRGASGEIRHREGFLFVTLAWSLAAALGALPFRLSGYIPSYLDAFFETISGFTTTGATILTQVEVLPSRLLLWRSLIQWLGGMGIIVLTIAILPYLRVGGMQIFRAESPGPTMDKLRPRIAETAKLLWSIYVGLTALEIVLLAAGAWAFSTRSATGSPPWQPAVSRSRPRASPPTTEHISTP